MSVDVVKCTKCGTYNDISDIGPMALVISSNNFSPDDTNVPIKIICEKCGERIEI